MRTRLSWALAAASALGPGGIPAPALGEGSPGVAEKGYAALKKFCAPCHGVAEEVPGFRVLDREILLAKPPGKKPAYVVPGKPEESLIWKRAVAPKRDMPPDYADVIPTEDDRKRIEDWIRGGAPFASEEARRALTDDAVVDLIRDHLRSLGGGAQERRNQRYLVLANLHNNPSIHEDQLRVHRAAASMLLNSLSWRREVRVPRAIDKDGAVLQLDLRWYGWTPETWDQVAARYPYGVLHSEDQTRLRETEEEIATLADSRLAYLRADWFAANASQPPLYDRILDLPATLAELETGRLSISSTKDLHNDDLARAGMVSSGVSLHNRVVERHETPYGAYWRSFDFNSSDLRGNIVRFPLGPSFEGNPNDRHAFVQAGGEVIFNLPNGLQAYMLADAHDRRLDAPAPVTIVRDRNEYAGTPQVVNGLSCMGCHRQGIIDCPDVIRDHPGVFGAPRDKVRRVYAPRARMKELVDLDRARFLDALDRAAGPFLKVGADKGSRIDGFNELITAVARLYLKDLTLEAAAAELGVGEASALRGRIEGNDRLKEVGLGPLLIPRGGLKRQLWERLPLSLFHQVCPEFGLTGITVR